MKICLVTEELAGFQGSGGIGAAFSELAKFLASSGYVVDVLYCPVGEVPEEFQRKMRDELMGKGIKISFLDYGKYFWGAHSYENKSYAVFQYLKMKDYDVVHFHDFKGLGFACVSAKRQGLYFENTKFVVQMHGPTAWTIKTNKTLYIHEDQLKIDFMERELVKKADYIISPSQYLLDFLGSEEGFEFPEGRTGVIKNLCSDLELQLNRFVKTDGSSIETINEIVLFARHEDRKGFVQFCDAIDELREIIESRNIQVTFLGKFGAIAGQPSGLYLAKRGIKWKFPVRIISHFHRKEAAEYLTSNESSLVVIPSEENSPYTVFETLVLKKPVITSMHGGARELIAEEDHAASLCDTESGSEIANAIKGWIENGGRAPRVSETSEEIESKWLKFHQNTIFEDNLKLCDRKRKPKVTFGITHYERPSKLLDAVMSAVKQTYENIEIVVVDDGSKSESTRDALNKIETLLKRVGGRIIYQENGYLGAARNTIARNTDSEYLCFLDDDDIAKSDLVEKLVTAAESSGAEVVNCLNQFMDISRRMEGVVDPDNFSEKVSYVPLGGPLSVAYKQNILGSATALIKREFFEIIGGYTELKGVGHEDFEFFLRVVQKGGKIEVIPEPLYLYEVGRPSMISNTSAIHNFKRIYSAIDFSSSESALRDFLNLEIGKIARETQENRMHWILSSDENSDLLLPILRGDFSGDVLLEKLAEFSSRIGSLNMAFAFERNAKEIINKSDIHEGYKKIRVLSEEKNKLESAGVLCPLGLEIRMDIKLGRLEDAIEGIAELVFRCQDLSCTDIDLIEEFSLSLGDKKLSVEKIKRIVMAIEESCVPLEEDARLVSALDRIVISASDNKFVSNYVKKIFKKEEEEYIESYEDLCRHFSGKEFGIGFKHYLRHGKSEGRTGFSRYLKMRSYLREELFS